MPHTDDELQFASKYFVYHFKMYVETFLWINSHKEKPQHWDTNRNAIIENNLVHARTLINFFYSQKKYTTDIVVADYFKNTTLNFYLEDDEFLIEQSKIIGGQLVHLTIKAKPELKSEQDWPIFDIKEHLIPLIINFLQNVPENRFDMVAKFECRSLLPNLRSGPPFVTINAST